VTVPVSDKTGVAGFVFPGDRVDMVLTQTIDGDDNQKLNSAETFLQNVRVLATDQSTTQEKNDKGETVVKTSETVTLEVTPVMAEKIAVAQSFGTLSLSLRSLADTNGGVEEALASGDIRIPPNATPEEEQRILRRFATRPVDSRGSYSTGGDVSRFQRRTPPPRGGDRETQNVRAYGEAVAGTLADRMGVPAGGAAAGQVVPTGPIVRIARGNEVTVVSVK
jgi:pilus assembly protein CpaB